MTVRRVGSDVVIAAVLFLLAAIAGSAVYTRAVHSARRPFFYQTYFEPAVMLACGKGFLITQPQPAPAALRAFLTEQRDRFSCDELPPGLTVGTTGLYQRPWLYFFTTVGAAWRVLGITWSGLGPLFGMLFGASAVLAYRLCRLIVGRVAATACTAAFCASPLQLSNLPNLRDYAKAPFTLALLAILIALVIRIRRRREVLLLALAYGIVMGIGYGFRSDFLIDIPPFLVAVVFFLPGGVLRNGALKLAATACFAAGFVAAGWPIISTAVSSGGCQWHVALLGLASPFNDALGVHGGSYGWGHLYDDQYVWASVSNYATRFRPDLGYIEYCSHGYDVASWEYYRRILLTFPADMMTRAFASALHVVSLPFARVAAMRVVGVLLAAAFVIAAGSVSARLAWFTVFVLVYFAGYPALQFLPRHYFPFEIIGWLLLAWAVERVVRRGFGGDLWRGAARAAVALAVLVATLLALRVYQQRRASALLEEYGNAQTDPLVVESRSGPKPTEIAVVAALGRTRARFLEITAADCRPGTAVTLRYDPAYSQTDFTRTVRLSGSGRGLTRLFEPVYDTFTGVDVSDPACVAHAFTVRGADRFPLLLSAQLPADWASQRQYQQMSWTR